MLVVVAMVAMIRVQSGCSVGSVDTFVAAVLVRG